VRWNNVARLGCALCGFALLAWALAGLSPVGCGRKQREAATAAGVASAQHASRAPRTAAAAGAGDERQRSHGRQAIARASDRSRQARSQRGQQSPSRRAPRPQAGPGFGENERRATYRCLHNARGPRTPLRTGVGLELGRSPARRPSTTDRRRGAATAAPTDPRAAVQAEFGIESAR